MATFGTDMLLERAERRKQSVEDRPSTVILVARAKGGDREAWGCLIDRYYSSLVSRYHGDLGPAIRKLYDTRDLVQSAIGDALESIGDLQNDGAFFAWITSIIRFKIANVRRRLDREVALEGAGNSPLEVQDREGGPEEKVSSRDQYLHTLRIILDLFPGQPEAMAAVVMKFLEDCDIHEMVRRFDRPRRTVYRWLEEGMARLKARLDR
jgi:RNA polymerase sigma factor (sigma-70 family)